MRAYWPSGAVSELVSRRGPVASLINLCKRASLSIAEGYVDGRPRPAAHMAAIQVTLDTRDAACRVLLSAAVVGPDTCREGSPGPG